MNPIFSIFHDFGSKIVLTGIVKSLNILKMVIFGQKYMTILIKVLNQSILAMLNLILFGRNSKVLVECLYEMRGVLITYARSNSIYRI